MSEFLGSFTALVHHSTLYIQDRQSKAAHLDWDPARERIHVQVDSVAVAVMPSVDGPVTVEVVEGTEDYSFLHERYNGTIETPSSQITIRDSNDDISLTVPADSKATHVQIFTDNPDIAEKVVIQIA